MRLSPERRIQISPKFRAVLFDFDLTLADSAPAILDCFNFALDRLGIPRVPENEICRLIGVPLADMFIQLLGRQYAAQRDEFIRLYRLRSDEIMDKMTTLFPAVPRTLELLKHCGVTLGIVSTKGRFRIEPILKREGLLEAFTVIIGGEDVSHYKPDPQGLLLALRRSGSSRSESVYVGDSLVDAETAMRANVPFVASLSGATSRETFKAFPVLGVIENLLELPELLGCNDAFKG